MGRGRQADTAAARQSAGAGRAAGGQDAGADELDVGRPAAVGVRRRSRGAAVGGGGHRRPVRRLHRPVAGGRAAGRHHRRHPGTGPAALGPRHSATDARPPGRRRRPRSRGITWLDHQKKSSETIDFSSAQTLGRRAVSTETVRLPGPGTRRQERRCVVSAASRRACVWWEREAGGELFAWAPVVRREDRANVLVYDTGGPGAGTGVATPVRLLACHYTEHNAVLAVDFGLRQPHLLRVLELASASVKVSFKEDQRLFSSFRPLNHLGEVDRFICY